MSKPSVIAIVDDDEAVREAMFDLLQVEGLTARMFDDAAAFLAHALAGDFACVITDVHMPKIDGLELQRRLRAGGSVIPMIFITSSMGEATRRCALQEGAAGWFTKPFDNEALLDALHAALSDLADRRRPSGGLT